jgi:hypothetical protein
MSQARKRSRMAPPQWRIVFNELTSFRNVIASANATQPQNDTPHIVITVGRKGTLDVLRVNAISPCRGSYVSARLVISEGINFGEETTPRDDYDNFDFCVDGKMMISALDNPTMCHCRGELSSFIDFLHLKLGDSENLASWDDSKIPLFHDYNPCPTVGDLEFRIKMSVEMAKLKECLRRAKKMDCEFIRIQVWLETLGAHEVSRVTFTVESDTKGYYAPTMVNPTTKDAQGNMTVVHAISDASTTDPHLYDTVEDSDGTAVIDNKFSVDKLRDYVSTLPGNRTIDAYMKQDAPLMLQHLISGSCGDEEEYVRFLLAAHAD